MTIVGTDLPKSTFDDLIASRLRMIRDGLAAARELRALEQTMSEAQFVALGYDEASDGNVTTIRSGLGAADALALLAAGDDSAPTVAAAKDFLTFTRKIFKF